MGDPPLKAGIIGVGSMGQHHARIYNELSTAELVGVFDTDDERARSVADKYGVATNSLDELLSSVDLVTVAVPTQHHAELANRCIDASVHALIEKPIASTLTDARALRSRANGADVTIQIGHIERFNPAFQTLLELIPEFEVIAVTAERLGPPIEREIEDTVVVDLMIHDLDVLLALVTSDLRSLQAMGSENGRYATAALSFEDGMVAQLTASRVTQRKTRRLTITARECVVDIDYIDQSVEIHRHSVPEYVERGGDMRYRHESIVERPVVNNGEPLKNELRAFVESVRTGNPPEVTVDDALQALELTHRIDECAFPNLQKRHGGEAL